MFFFFQAEDGIRDAQESRGLGDVYKRQVHGHAFMLEAYIRKVKEQYCAGKKVVTIITGGIAELLVPLIPSIDVLDKTLTLDGLHLAFRQLSRK